MATHSSILPWRIPWSEEPGGYSPQYRKELDMTEVTQHTLHAHLSISLLCAENLKVSRTGRLSVSLIHTTKRLFVQSRFSNSHSPGPEGNGCNFYSQSMGGRIIGFNVFASKAQVVKLQWPSSGSLLNNAIMPTLQINTIKAKCQLGFSDF